MPSKAKELAVLLSGSGSGTIAPALVSDQANTSTGAFSFPSGTEAQRPSSPINGSMRYNQTTSLLEHYGPDGWVALATPPTITSLAYAGDDLAADTAGGTSITLTGENFESGFNVTVGGTQALTTSYGSATSVSFTAPAKSAGTYDVVVTNPNGLNATLQNGITYSGTPAFQTAANLGSFDPNTTVSNITIVAADPDGGAISYSITSGGVPAGLTFNSDGTVTGTTQNPSNGQTTTSYFTVEAVDDENQSNTQQYNITVLRPLYAYPVANSLVFNDDDSSYLSKTLTDGDSATTYTISLWFKLGSNLGTTTRPLFAAGGSATWDAIYISSADTIAFSQATEATSNFRSTLVVRDTTAWYHLVLSVDTAGSSPYVKAYLNGDPIAWTTQSQPSPNATSQIGTATTYYVGRNTAGSAFFDGQITEFHYVDGYALTPSSFSETYNNVYQPKEYTGNYGSNGFYLKMDTDGIPNIVDETGTRTLTINGSTAKSTGQAKFGGTSILTGGGGNANVTSGYGIQYSADNTVSPDGSNNITFECWYYNDGSTYGTIWHGRQSDWYNPYLYTSTNGSVVWWNQTNGGANGGSYTATQTMTAGWNHIAVCVSGNTVNFYINGVAAGSNTWASGTWSVIGTNMIGAGATVYMDDIRISNTIRYTGTFTPPTAYSTADGDTRLLIQSNYSSTANIGADSSGNSKHFTPVNFKDNRLSEDTPTE